ncbi:Protein CBR-GCY-29 [Caenorhabditis briggsae]|uniref:guanylate cyclase n=1 Tax=Caenorhabditis briggsae TaxID=6238 RepID=A8XYU1_CAEBR|nr:Protein CBR-GCY-29 [Caenorhabditis briggsae]CAP37808.2 Protein CBR-GCY-29 [Caenorhabditis briggsae]
MLQNFWNFQFIFIIFCWIPIVFSDEGEIENNQKIILKIGSISTRENGKMLMSIMEMAKKKMTEQGVLGTDFGIEILNVEGCGSSFEGVAGAAELFHVQHIDAFFGPFCSKELSPVATMASYWNIPIFAYTATSAEFSDSKVYKTLLRTSFQSLSSIFDATAAFLIHHNFTKVAIVANIGTDSFERIQSLEKSLKSRGITITRRVMFEENSSAEELVENGITNELKNNARVIIPLFSSTRDLSTVFRNATIIAEMSSSDFIYVHPLIVAKNFAEPSTFYGKLAQKSMKEEYPDTIQIYNSYGFSDKLLNEFMSIFNQASKRIYIDEKGLFNYVALYESFCVFAKLAQKYIRFNGKNIEGRNGFGLDGQLMRKMAVGMNFEGVLDNFTLDNGAERMTSFSAFYVDSKRDQIRTVALINSTTTTKNCMEPVCVDLIVSDVVTKYWSTPSGNLPDVDPECGFRGENCDYTQTIVLITAATCLLMTAGLAILLKRACETKALEKMPWRILRDDVEILDEEQAKSVISLGSATTKMSQVETKLVKNHAIVGVNTHAIYDIFEQRQNIKFKREDLILLTKMKQAVHDNINPFIGVSFNEKSELLLLWKFCSRGTLQDVIYCDKFNMDEKFHGAFVRDITLGLEYLHSSSIGFHGGLASWTALIDKNWMLKLTDYAIGDPLKRWEKHGRINCKVDNESEQEWQKMASLYVPPEIRTANEKNRMKRMDQKWQAQSILRRQQSDIYAFGVIIYEILFRSLPYDEKVDLTELAQKASEGEKIQRPSIQKNKKLNPDMIALLQDCWSGQPDMRPTIRRVRLATEIALKTKGNLVDSMMKMMEEYANNLEKLVGERTKLAEEANLRAERLLFQLLPKNVVIELKAGRSVPPKLYDSATVMFSDIVGFTKLCSASTPIEVVNLLNKLYSEFDSILNKQDCYKVETIGDAYMVVSGIPMENGRRHVANIASVTLEIMELLKTFVVPHRQNHRLSIRLGFASGPVAAAVVGLNSPRFCLFGETVNIASIMESSGEGERIQITDSSKILLANEYPEYIIEIRGINKEVNQSEFTTHWLVGKDEEYFKKK